MAQRVWTEDETLLAFRLYNLTQYGRIHSGNKDIQALAALLGRTIDAVAMKMLNLASFDPTHLERGVVSLKSASKRDKEIWERFYARAGDLYWASEEALKRLQREQPDAPLPAILRERKFSGPTEAYREAPVRLAQRYFRDVVLTAYQGRCAVSGIDKPELLNASHIIPWGKDSERRSDPRNGIALSALHDRAFDRGLISFDEARRMLVSAQLKQGQPNELLRTAILEFEGKTLDGAERYSPDPLALAYHRERVFKAG